MDHPGQERDCAAESASVTGAARVLGSHQSEMGRASESGNARAAMNSAKQANAIYVGKFGAEDQRSKDNIAKMKRYLSDAVKAVRSARLCICPIVRGIQ